MFGDRPDNLEIANDVVAKGNNGDRLSDAGKGISIWVKRFAIGWLQKQITHVMDWFTLGVKQGGDILSEVVPFIIAPGVVPLEGGNMVAQSVTH